MDGHVLLSSTGSDKSYQIKGKFSSNCMYQLIIQAKWNQSELDL